MPLIPSGRAELDLNFASVYWTHQDLFGTRMTEQGVIELLKQIAVEDCVEALSRLSCLLDTKTAIDVDRQRLVIDVMQFAPAIADDLHARVTETGDGPPRVLFFSQQVTHLMRLALTHCAQRPADHFADNQQSELFIRALFGVTDLFYGELAGGGVDAQMRFMLRQLGLTSRPDIMTVFSRYYDLLLNVWPQVILASEFDAAAVFLRHTGLTIEQYLTIGFGIYSRFMDYGQQAHPETFSLRPEIYYATTRVDEADWTRFLELTSTTIPDLRAALEQEDEQYGQTHYRSHAFDRTPLVKVDDGRFMPVSFAAFERTVTEGIFWILANATEADGLAREKFTGPFGKVFERFVQESIERIARMESQPPATFRDFYYGPRKQPVLSSDMTIVYPGEAMFCEVVTGRPNVPTITRGDLPTFWNDTDRLVSKKARQLKRCVSDFFITGNLRFDGTGAGQVQKVWPVLIMVEEFPLMPPIRGQIEERLRKRSNWPHNVPRLTILDADELAVLEALVEAGSSISEVLHRWKREEPELPLVNWLTARGYEHPGHATWHAQTFRRLTELVAVSIFGQELSDIEDERGEIFGVTPTEPAPEA